MTDSFKTNQELLEEISILKQKIRELEKSEEKHKRTEEALWKSEASYRQLFDNSPIGIYQINFRTGKFSKANDVFCEYLGYSQKEIASLSPYDILTEESQKTFTERANKIMLGDKVPDNPEFEIINKKGQKRWVQLNTKFFYDSEGLAGADVVAHDITARKQMEKVLHESENKFKYLVEQARAGIYLVQDGVFKYVNPQFARMFGYTVEECLNNMPFQNLVYKEDVTKVEEHVQNRITGKIEFVHYGFRGLKKNSQIFHVEIYGSVGVHEGRLASTGTILDITERRQTEEALRKEEEKYRTLIENIRDGVFIIQDARLQFVNKAFAKMTGYTVEEVTGMEMQQLVFPDDLEMVADRYRRRQAGENISEEYEFRILHKDKKTPVSVNMSAGLIDYRGRLASIGMLQDLTERNRAEEEKRNLEERLQRAEKMEALGTLAGGVAHDLNNVLGIVVGYAEMLLMNTDESSSIRPQLANIMKGGQGAAAIVDDLLTLARRGVHGRQVLNINKIIAETQQSPEFKKLLSYHPFVKIATDLEPDLLNISGSSVHLSKTLFNLASNACEAMPHGGILNIKTADQYLDKPLYGYDEVREGDYVVLSVSDTGEGIPAADLKRIFEPFYTKKVMGRSGTGLGLAVVWGTVKDHHGYINIQSEEGKGSTFSLYFPVTREDISADTVAVAISEYMGLGESILVVDDVKEQRDLAASMLRRLNYTVASVSSGEEALTHVREHRVDLMVLDMIMDPGMDGLDTYKSVLEIHPQQKAIIVSGFSESNRVHDAQALGAGAYVRKPYVIEKLGLAVRKELDRK